MPGTLRGGAVTQFCGAIDGRQARLCQRSIQNGLERYAILPQLVINAGREINIAAGDARNGGLCEVERLEGFFDSFLQLGQMKHASVGPGLLHVFWNGPDARVRSPRHVVVSAAPSPT